MINMINKKLESNIIIVISAMRKIIDIFLGPFLTAYFIRISKDSIVYLSIYYIFSYSILGIATYFVAKYIKNKFRIGMFRVGIILNFIYILSIILLNEKIIKFLPLISILQGLSLATYYFPYNLFVINKVNNSDRTDFTVNLQTVSSIIGVLCPFVLGSIITITNYNLTASIILIVSIVQIVLSFLLSKDEKSYYSNFDISRVFNKLKSNKQIKQLLKVEIFTGMNKNGALEILNIIFIFESFKTNMNLGIITSITTIFSIFFIELYAKKYKRKNDKNIIILSSIIPVILTFTLILINSPITIIIYYIAYVIFTSMLSLTREIRIFNIANSYLVNKNDQCEFFAIREIYLNIGRAIGFFLLLLVGMYSNQISIYVILLILDFTLLLMGNSLTKISKFEKDIH